MTLRLNISPCPNDTFMFDALINKRIDTRGICLSVNYLDIEQLNDRLMSGSGPDVSKMSYALLGQVLGRYRLLDAGSALGYGTGPVLVKPHKNELGEPAVGMRDGGPGLPESFLGGARVAIPGEHTTAARLLRRFFPAITDTPAYLFSDIAGAISRGEVDAGVLIHEGRFTYRTLGLELVADLGELWERQMQMPLPLGAIVVSRSLPEETQQLVNQLVKESIEYAFAYPDASREFVRVHAQELNEQVVASHIATFVNDYSLGLDATARAGIAALLGLDEKVIFA